MPKCLSNAILPGAVLALIVMFAPQANANCGPAACTSFFDEAFCRAQCLGNSSNQSTSGFGAIALDQRSGSHGYSFDWRSRKDAEAAAMRECRAQTNGQNDCSVVLWFTGACGALAQAGSNWGTAWASSSRAAAASARSTCEGNGKACEVSRTVCSF
jgi:hypothetical protein